jgi:hypothetical protein
MATKITDQAMTSDETGHTATATADGWAVSWLPGRTLTHSQSITAMTIAESVDAALDPYALERVWPHVAGWAAELGLSDVDAVALASLCPEHHADAGAR